MTYAKNLSPFRAYNGAANYDVYEQKVADSSMELGVLSAIGSNIGNWIGFRLREHCRDRGVWCHTSQSWKTAVMLCNVTAYDGSTARTDQTLMGALRGSNSGAFNFGDDAEFFSISKSNSSLVGPKVHQSYQSKVPTAESNVDQNLAILIFTKAG